MKKAKYIILVAMLAPMLTFAKGGTKSKKPSQQLSLAAGCAPASKIIFLEFNNVRTRVEAGGIWWQDRANNLADYEVPQGSNSYALYAGGLWLAGTDVNGQLKAAVSKFGTGVDYYTGPLTTTSTAEIDEETCAAYDRFFELKKADVAQFVAYNNAKANGEADEKFPNYQIPQAILEWPGNGDVTLGQDFILAPYWNVAGDASYEPELGDYPKFDLQGDVDCRENREDRSISARRPLFGDQTYWWIFNDKGNLHTESNAPSIGMEIHGQAFAFATNDEINDMTFYNFELINRSTFTLTNTYFASYVDPDLGNAQDDYVGCDVIRGLGYCYNGDETDESTNGQVGYGSTPAAIGIDFFEGPYQDADNINNNVGIGPGEALNGLGYFDPNSLDPDSIIDNERFGMRRFVYYNNNTAQNGDPELAVHYYNYMRGIWKNGRRMRHGGDGFTITSAAVENIATDFMFPGDSDPLHWGTTDENGVTQIPVNQDWREDNPGGGLDRNAEGDRRFLQSAGSFTLEPGNVNDITVGVVFAQAQSGGRLASVEKLFQADDKAQALFDNCFQVLNGPDAPDVEVQELNRELVFYLTNPETSNNINESYAERDPNIVTPEYLLKQTPPIMYDDSFRFQGYQVYQLAGPGISVNDIEDADKARLAFQADVKDDVVDLVNFTFDEELGANVPVKKVVANNDGITRSFSLTEDLFASGNTQLINFKTYYYIAIAYGYNEFKPYLQGSAPDSANPFKPAFDGQTTPYISSRKNGSGGSVEAFTAIPHNPLYESNGTVTNSNYGDEIGITRLQGKGNGGNPLEITDGSLDNLFETKAWLDESVTVNEIDYVPGNGPFKISVIDPLNVRGGTYYLKILDEDDSNGDAQVTGDARWILWIDGGVDTVSSEGTIDVGQEKLLLDPNWGLSITFANGVEPGSRVEGTQNGFISASIAYDNPENAWLSGISDTDFEGPSNWILAGTNTQSSISSIFNDFRFDGTGPFLDPNENYESILNGIIAPYNLVRNDLAYNVTGTPAEEELAINSSVNAPGNTDVDRKASPMEYLNSIQLIMTSDKSKWTRCPVVETKDDGVEDANGNVLYARLQAKLKLSVDKDGNTADTTGFGNLSRNDLNDTLAALGRSDNEDDAAFVDVYGMGWFPGYVINKETGERLNLVFGEDSRYSLNNGDDMMWNPTSTIAEGVDPRFINNIWGGKHYLYIFRRTQEDEFAAIPPIYRQKDYDAGRVLIDILKSNSSGVRRFAYRSCMWVAIPTLAPGEELLSSDVQIDVNVSVPYGVKNSTISENSNIDSFLENDGRPVYKFSTADKAASTNQRDVLADALVDVNVVPNPYYAISEYETTQLENTVKFTNLPENCKISIYNSSGTLIRRYNKSSPLNFLDWDLNNQVGIPISSGVYIIHIEVPGVGEKILKWFGVVRPVDLNNF